VKKPNINPLILVAAKQKVGEEDANEMALPVLVHFDAAKRGQCTAAGANHLTLHLICAAYIAAQTKSKTFYDCVQRAYAALMKAADRPTKLLDLTTGEYASMRAAISMYIRALPKVEVWLMNEASKHAARVMEA
jgi:hypothetical protein